MIARRIIHAVTAWWLARPTRRRIERLRARHADLRDRIREARKDRNTARLHVLYSQYRHATNELLRMELGRLV
jgi:hypothetical protein